MSSGGSHGPCLWLKVFSQSFSAWAGGEDTHGQPVGPELESWCCCIALLGAVCAASLCSVQCCSIDNDSGKSVHTLCTGREEEEII